MVLVTIGTVITGSDIGVQAIQFFPPVRHAVAIGVTRVVPVGQGELRAIEDSREFPIAQPIVGDGEVLCRESTILEAEVAGDTGHGRLCGLTVEGPDTINVILLQRVHVIVVEREHDRQRVIGMPHTQRMSQFVECHKFQAEA